MDAYEDIDELNDETFGAAEDGDWELEHEQFALAQSHPENIAPEADQLPKFWEASDDVSFLWQPSALDNYKTLFADEERERGVNVEETLQRLVSEDEVFEDPAILDISKKYSSHKLSGSALDKLLGVPAFPTSLFSSSKDIWSSDEITTGHRQLPSQADSSASSKNASISLKELLRHMAQRNVSSGTNGTEIPQKVPDVMVSRDSLPNLSEPRFSAQSAAPTTNTSNAMGVDRVKFGGPSDFVSGLQIDKAVPRSMNLNTTNTASVPTWSQQMESSLRQLTNNSLQKQHLDPSQIPSLLRMASSTTNAMPPLTNYRQNTTPDYLRTSALHLLLMQSQNARFAGRPPTTLPDPRLFQLMPPPSVAGLVQLPTPLIRSHRPMGPGQFNHTATPLLAGSSTSVPLIIPDAPLWRVLSPNLLPVRPLSTISPISGSSHQRQTATRDSGLSNEVAAYRTSVSADEEFDPNHGSWMSEYEWVNVLLSHLQPIMVSNPYVQDYYFAVSWLRRMNLTWTKQLTGVLDPSCPPPIMLMPSPVTLDLLSDSTHYQHTAHHVRFIIPMVVPPLLANQLHSASSNSPTTGEQNATETVNEDAGQKTPTNDRKPSTIDNNSALGRPMRANMYRPRVLIELSLASVLTGDHNNNSSPHGEKIALAALPDPAPRSVKASRAHRLVLARIERMYTLMLNLDEVDIALQRVVVQNETRSRLSHHRSDLIESLVLQLCSTSRQLATDQHVNVVDVFADISLLATPILELFSVRKGIRLLSKVLHYLPQHSLCVIVRVLVSNYAKVCAISENQIDEFASLLYPILRTGVYQILDIAEFMTSCFPEVRDSLTSMDKPSDTVCALIHSKLGLSLIFCLLDVCARLSKPDDPSNFVRFGAYFILVASDLPETPLPLESFPHLASILPVYVKPETQPPLTATCVNRFCRMIDPNLVSQRGVLDQITLVNGSNLPNGAAKNSTAPNELMKTNSAISLAASVDESDTTKRTTMVAT